MEKKIEKNGLYFHFNIEKFNVEFIRIIEVPPFESTQKVYEEEYLSINNEGDIYVVLKENIFDSMSDLSDYAHYILERKFEDEYLRIMFDAHYELDKRLENEYLCNTSYAHYELERRLEEEYLSNMYDPEEEYYKNNYIS